MQRKKKNGTTKLLFDKVKHIFKTYKKLFKIVFKNFFRDLNNF